MIEKIIQPKEFHRLLEANRLGELQLRQEEPKARYATERTLNLHDLWKTIFDYELTQPRIQPSNIHSVILFGSAVNKAPVKTIEGAKHKFWKWTWQDENYTAPINIHDVDLLVINKEEEKIGKTQATLLDLGYPSYSQVKGNIDYLFTTKEHFTEKAKEGTENTTNIIRDGIILADDGTYLDLTRPYEDKKRPQYRLVWSLKDKYSGGGLFSYASLDTKDVLHGKLQYTGEIPFVPLEEQ